MKQTETPYRGKWHGKRTYFGYHHDLHVDPTDTEIGARSDEAEHIPTIQHTRADFVQTDAKGHPGYTSWYSKTPGASVAPGIVKDALKGWRAATKRLGLPLHCHYSGIYDKAAGAQHPDWCIIDKTGKAINTPGWYGPDDAGDRMCPRSPYVDELMIPQLLELIDNYDIDGFWIDGDTWAAAPCYCDRCRQAFKEQTGIDEPPTDAADPNWNTWWNFTRESFEAYVTRYCDAVHQHRPGVLVATSWLQGFRYPGEPRVPTDWITGDTPAIGDHPLSGEDVPRCDARFISTRGKPWDLMIWSFYGGFQNSTVKSVEMLQQQAATILALGGNLQTCANPFGGPRSGQSVPWRIEHVGKLAAFVKQRQELCQGAETIPQVAVLHSEHHFRAIQTGEDLFITVDMAAPRGATLSLLECQYGVDILDEWALLPRLADFPLVVAPEQDQMSTDMVDALKQYVTEGGRLLVSGAGAFARFGGDFLGVSEGRVEDDASYYVPVDQQSAQVTSRQWRLVEATTAQTLLPLTETALRDERRLPHPAATLNGVGKGFVAYVPCDLFRNFNETTFPLTRRVIHEVMCALAGRLDIEVQAPTIVDVVLRQQGKKKIIHLINRNLTNTQEVTPIGPITIKLDVAGKAGKVYAAFETGDVSTEETEDGRLLIELPAVYIHQAIVVEEDSA